MNIFLLVYLISNLINFGIIGFCAGQTIKKSKDKEVDLTGYGTLMFMSLIFGPLCTTYLIGGLLGLGKDQNEASHSK